MHIKAKIFTTLLALLTVTAYSGKASAKCINNVCADPLDSPSYLGKHIRLHKGNLENAKAIAHCTDVGNLPTSINIQARSMGAIEAIKNSQANPPKIKVIINESSTACMIGMF